MPKPTVQPKLSACERAIGYRFRNRKLLELALTHRSFAHESGGPIGPDNDRMEFLGDSVLGLVIAELAYKRWPQYTEGQLTEARSDHVSRRALARKAAHLKLDRFMRLGKGQVRTGTPPDTILSCGIEAVIGAIYLDGGLAAATRFIRRRIWERSTRHKPRSLAVPTNYKEKLQKHSLERHQQLPTYSVTTQSGPAHRRHFTMSVRVKGKIVAKGQGLSKKEASQDAARQALRKLRVKL